MLSIRMRLVLVVTLLLLWPQPVVRAEASAAKESVLLVQLCGSPTEEQARVQLRALGLEPVRRIPRIDVWVARPAQDTDTALRHLARNDAVIFAEEDGIVTACDALPNDPLYPQQWSLPLIGAPAAWDLARGMAAPIAIVDTGIDLDHGDLLAKLWVNAGEIPGNGLDDDGNGYVDDVYGYDIYSGDDIPQDDNGHGSHVAGIAAAASNDAYGMAGLAWGTPLMAVKVLSASNSGSWSHLAEGIIYAADNGAAIINLSLGSSSSDPSLTVQAAIDYAHERGCLIVAAAGNNGASVLFPASLPGVVAVGASDANDDVWTSSSRGPELDLAAPGVNVLSCDEAGGWMQLTGTSMATPHVAGAAALIRGLRPDLSRHDVPGILKATAVDIGDPGDDENSGAGRLDLGAAVGAASRWGRRYLPVAGAR